MDKDELIWMVINQIKEDIRAKDDMPLYELLGNVPQKKLEDFLPDYE